MIGFKNLLILNFLFGIMWANGVQCHMNSLSSELNVVSEEPNYKPNELNSPTTLVPENLVGLYVQQQRKELRKTATTQAVTAKLLFPYRTYRDVQILYFSIPEQTYLASWKLVSNTTKNSKCKRKKINFHLRQGGFPIVDPDNSTFPSDMYLGKNVFISVSFESDMPATYLNVSAPNAGDWFAVSYIEEDTDKIVQKGLFTVCQAWLHTRVKYYTEESVISLMPSVTLNNDGVQNDQFYRFYTSHNIWSAEITISKCSVENTTTSHEGDCPIAIYSRPLALPRGTEEDTWVNCSFSQEQSDCKIEVSAVSDGWNFLLVKVQTLSEVQFQITVNTAACQESSDKSFEVADVPHHPSARVPKFPGKSFSHKQDDSYRNESSLGDSIVFEADSESYIMEATFGPSAKSCWPRVHLVRNNLPGNFAYRFDQLPDVNDSTPILVNFSMNAVSLLSFDLTSLLDTGGTLAVEMILPKTLVWD